MNALEWTQPEDAIFEKALADNADGALSSDARPRAGLPLSLSPVLVGRVPRARLGVSAAARARAQTTPSAGRRSPPCSRRRPRRTSICGAARRTHEAATRSLSPPAPAPSPALLFPRPRGRARRYKKLYWDVARIEAGVAVVVKYKAAAGSDGAAPAPIVIGGARPPKAAAQEDDGAEEENDASAAADDDDDDDDDDDEAAMVDDEDEPAAKKSKPESKASEAAPAPAGAPAGAPAAAPSEEPSKGEGAKQGGDTTKEE